MTVTREQPDKRPDRQSPTSPTTPPCAALDILLANRLPDVVVLTAGGRGVPMLAASYATANGLEVVVRVADFARFPVDAVERRVPRGRSDTAVVVWVDRDPETPRRVARLR